MFRDDDDDKIPWTLADVRDELLNAVLFVVL